MLGWVVIGIAILLGLTVSHWFFLLLVIPIVATAVKR